VSPAILHGLYVGEHGADVEETGEHVAALGDPAHRLGAKRVHGEEERGGGGAQPQPYPAARRRLQREPKEPEAQEIERERGTGVEQEIGQVVAPRRHPPDRVIPAQGEPGQRHVVAHVEGGEHPRELPRTEAAIVRVLEEGVRIVPVDEFRRERGQEDADGGSDHDRPEHGARAAEPDLARHP
jgi:hypothetical protein